jgi:hypothetical protein
LEKITENPVEGRRVFVLTYKHTGEQDVGVDALEFHMANLRAIASFLDVICSAYDTPIGYFWDGHHAAFAQETNSLIRDLMKTPDHLYAQLRTLSKKTNIMESGAVSEFIDRMMFLKIFELNMDGHIISFKPPEDDDIELYDVDKNPDLSPEDAQRYHLIERDTRIMPDNIAAHGEKVNLLAVGASHKGVTSHLGARGILCSPIMLKYGGKDYGHVDYNDPMTIECSMFPETLLPHILDHPFFAEGDFPIKIEFSRDEKNPGPLPPIEFNTHRPGYKFLGHK